MHYTRVLDVDKKTGVTKAYGFAINMQHKGPVIELESLWTWKTSKKGEKLQEKQLWYRFMRGTNGKLVTVPAVPVSVAQKAVDTLVSGIVVNITTEGKKR